jgi:demethylmenaquinone methyltransferase/2-methoxy-6-polyprenyl-1,4-benzoquinol methylase
MRRAYYDKFSRFYDRFVSLHSRDPQGLARKFLTDRLPVENGGSVLDICTGTATLLSHLQAKVGREGQVVGVDFSPGMLKVCREKTRSFPNVYLVEADAGRPTFPQEGSCAI